MEQSLPVALGFGILGYSALTAYELGLIRVFPMPAHLGLDVVNAGLLLAVPWFFGFSRKAKGTCTAEGLLESAVILTPQTTPGLTAGHARRQRD
ncbi:MAG: hypothetical protein U0075_26175 [Thermomicrobiales bacterium]